MPAPWIAPSGTVRIRYRAVEWPRGGSVAAPFFLGGGLAISRRSRHLPSAGAGAAEGSARRRADRDWARGRQSSDPFRHGQEYSRCRTILLFSFGSETPSVTRPELGVVIAFLPLTEKTIRFQPKIQNRPPKLIGAIQAQTARIAPAAVGAYCGALRKPPRQTSFWHHWMCAAC